MVGASFKSDVFDRANHAWEFMLHMGVEGEWDGGEGA